MTCPCGQPHEYDDHHPGQPMLVMRIYPDGMIMIGGDSRQLDSGIVASVLRDVADALDGNDSGAILLGEIFKR
jgi:hypothetical protein